MRAAGGCWRPSRGRCSARARSAIVGLPERERGGEDMSEMRGHLLQRAVPWAVRAASGAVRAAVGALRRVVCRGGEVRAAPVVRGMGCGALGRWGVPWDPVPRAPVASAQRWGAVGPLGDAVAGGRRGPLLYRWGVPWCGVPRDSGGQRFMTDCYGTVCSRVADTSGGVYHWWCEVEGDLERKGPDIQNGRTGTTGQGQPNPRTEPNPGQTWSQTQPKKPNRKTAQPIRYPVPRYPEK